jgi:DNA-binding transcriptional LysR family regulator
VDLHHVRYFLAVIDHGSINVAADAVGVSQPTISQALRALERELRTPLFFRIGRGMAPTSAGYALVGPARRLMRDIATAGGSVLDDEGHLRGKLDIRSLPALSVGMLPTLVAEYRRRHPKVAVTIDSLRDETAAATHLRNAVCEIVLTHLPFDRSQPRDDGDRALDALEIGAQEYWIAYPPGATAPASDPLPWDEIDTPMVAVPVGGSHATEILRMLPPAQRVRPPAAILQNREARLAFMLAGVGATWIERSMAGLARERGAQVRALIPALKAPYGLVFERDGLSPAAAAFVELARTHVGISADSATSRNAAPAGDS